MRKRLLLICTLALMGLVPLKAQEMVVAIDGGATATPSMPFVNNNANGWSQSIYTASMINLPAGGTITAIAYECGQVPTTAWNQPQVTIYMANTSMTAAANNNDWLQASTMTQVYSGTNAEATAVGWHTITLSTPFEYTGGNLAIVISKNGATGTNLRYKTYNGDPAVSGSALFKTGTSTQPTTTGTMSKNLPNIKITMQPNAACMPVENLAASSSTAGMNVNWTVNAVSTTPQRYEIEYGLHGFTYGDGTKVVTTNATPSYTITGLNAMSRYDVYVRAICGEGDTAPAVMLDANYCAPVSLPWNWQSYAAQVNTYMNWNINNELPGCWEFPGISTTAAGYPRIWASTDATNGLHFQVRTNTEKPAVIIFPEIDARLNEVAIGLTATYATVPFPVVQYGYLTNLADTTSFIALGEFVSGDNYKVTEAGTYTIVFTFDGTNGTITLEK